MATPTPAMTTNAFHHPARKRRGISVPREWPADTGIEAILLQPFVGRPIVGPKIGFHHRTRRMFGPGGWTFVLGVRLDAAPWLEREHVHGEIVASVDAAGEGEHLAVQGSLDDRAQVILERVL